MNNNIIYDSEKFKAMIDIVENCHDAMQSFSCRYCFMDMFSMV